MNNYNKEKVLSCLHLIQDHIKQIEEIVETHRDIIMREHLSDYCKWDNPPNNTREIYNGIEPKIGVLVKNQLKNILEQRWWSEQEFLDFFDESYSKTTFDINYPLLSLYRFDDKLYPRYYKYPLLVNAKECYLCSQWYEGSREKLLDFLNQYENL